jgi:predicted secreted protein
MRVALLVLALLTLPAVAAETDKKTGTLVDFRVELQKSVPNDLGRASAYAETTGASPEEVARKLKATLGEALAVARAQPGVTVKSGGTHTTPVHAKGGRSIEAWRMRSELLLESRDAAALSTAVGKLQPLLAIGSLQFLPAPETRRQVEDEATAEAIAAFRAKAERIGSAMAKTWRIRSMNIGSAGHFAPPMALMRASAMAVEAAPMPVEAGESQLTINIAGQIELLE